MKARVLLSLAALLTAAAMFAAKPAAASRGDYVSWDYDLTFTHSACHSWFHLKYGRVAQAYCVQHWPDNPDFRVFSTDWKTLTCDDPQGCDFISLIEPFREDAVSVEAVYIQMDDYGSLPGWFLDSGPVPGYGTPPDPYPGEQP
jgi:hypothetical protein